ncbi:hypothetical protein NP233_g10140 [Leucocoprinus birnbaumii]|uniref:Uncharacterized protein n=1 Tax=Leucocoprinus birnbaumii TaxID=56174 RepID=A0AAD5VJD0_9AGAR|nr:hypothetical protein NP233_g10140 [Leucocoprinus birnbaumii]
MATSFVFSPIPRFHQLVTKARITALALQAHGPTTSQEADSSSLSSLAASSPSLSALCNLESQSSLGDHTNLQPSKSPDPSSTWIPLSRSDRHYTAALWEPADEALEPSASKPSRNGLPLPISPPKRRSSINAEAGSGNVKCDVHTFNQKKLLSSDPWLANYSSLRDSSVYWLNLKPYKPPTIVQSLPDVEGCERKSITVPPIGSRSRLARILNDRTNRGV